MDVKLRMGTVADAGLSPNSTPTLFDPPKLGQNPEIPTLIWSLLSFTTVYQRQSIGVSDGKVHK
ncbi:hypothetical protein [Natronomonas sp. EA1]|uniref:hypothetical protein n=1 Tax=Natronomonas sp. EA1 TaxID=3421655 RepID=UPI003EBEF318